MPASPHPATPLQPPPERPRLLLPLAFLLAPLLSRAAERPDGTLVLRRFVARAASARGGFEQRATGRGGPAGEVSRGTFVFARPGRFAWRVTDPGAQDIVSDGRTLRLYDHELAQVVSRPLGRSPGGAEALLFGDEGALAEFELADAPRLPSGCDSAVSATPRRDDPSFARMEVGFDGGGVPLLLRLLDHFGGVTEISLRDVELNGPVSDADFALDLPPGVETVEDLSRLP